MKKKGTIFKLGIKGSKLCNDMVIHEQMFYADISWLSKYRHEKETFIEAGTKIGDMKVTVESEDPRVELVTGTLYSGFDMEELEKIAKLDPKSAEIAKIKENKSKEADAQRELEEKSLSRASGAVPFVSEWEKRYAKTEAEREAQRKYEEAEEARKEAAAQREVEARRQREEARWEKNKEIHAQKEIEKKQQLELVAAGEGKIVEAVEWKNGMMVKRLHVEPAAARSRSTSPRPPAVEALANQKTGFAVGTRASGFGLTGYVGTVSNSHHAAEEERRRKLSEQVDWTEVSAEADFAQLKAKKMEEAVAKAHLDKGLRTKKHEDWIEDEEQPQQDYLDNSAHLPQKGGLDANKK